MQPRSCTHTGKLFVRIEISQSNVIGWIEEEKDGEEGDKKDERQPPLRNVHFKIETRIKWIWIEDKRLIIILLLARSSGLPTMIYAWATGQDERSYSWLNPPIFLQIVGSKAFFCHNVEPHDWYHGSDIYPITYNCVFFLFFFSCVQAGNRDCTAEHVGKTRAVFLCTVQYGVLSYAHPNPVWLDISGLSTSAPFYRLLYT